MIPSSFLPPPSVGLEPPLPQTFDILDECTHYRRQKTQLKVALQEFLMHFQLFEGIKYHKFSRGACPQTPCLRLLTRLLQPPTSDHAPRPLYTEGVVLQQYKRQTTVWTRVFWSEPELPWIVTFLTNCCPCCRSIISPLSFSSMTSTSAISVQEPCRDKVITNDNAIKWL